MAWVILYFSLARFIDRIDKFYRNGICPTFRKNIPDENYNHQRKVNKFSHMKRQILNYAFANYPDIFLFTSL